MVRYIMEYILDIKRNQALININVLKNLENKCVNSKMSDIKSQHWMTPPVCNVQNKEIYRQKDIKSHWATHYLKNKVQAVYSSNVLSSMH